jgi:uncharacterized repeat protein (TIGR03803 family)
MKMIRLIGMAVIWAFAATMHAQSYKVLVNFIEKPSEPIEPGIIAQSRGGYLLTTSPDYQAYDNGTAFRVETSGALTVLHEFDKSDGSLPAGGLTLGRDGRFYGTTVFGGTNNSGTIFQMTPDGIVKTLHEFVGAADGYPEAAPIQSLYGDFYGTTTGNDANPGTIYKIDTNGSFTSLHTFTGADGSNPLEPLVQATSFWFYGTTEHGGPNQVGTIFRINSSGDFEVLFNFDYAHGAYPVALIQAIDGNFYGASYLGGQDDQGVVFKMTPTRQVTVLHEFTGGNDGFHPLGNLIQATDGYLYGTAAEGGASGGGVLFRISTSGEFTVLHSFEPSTGSAPMALIQHTNGFLYGDTNTGGTGNGGVFYRFNLGLPPFVKFLDSYGRVGMTVQILGEGFTAESQVFFNGMPAQVTQVQPTYLKVVVPDRATSGSITVTTTKGPLTSNKEFLVRP